MSIIKTQDKTDALPVVTKVVKSGTYHLSVYVITFYSIFFPLCTIIQSKTVESQRRPLHRNLRLTWFKNDLVPYIHAGPL